MEKKALSALEPRSVFHFFEELSHIPRESGNMRAVSDWTVSFAKERGLRRCQDTLGNVIIWKDASPGYEDHPAVILQGHLDMVCVQDVGSEHDFAKDPLDLYVDGDWVKARGTTLGGDNGIAVAMMLALLDDDTLVHPPIEAVFTADEEVGLLGAKDLDTSQLTARRFINLDSEEEGVFTAGCAGGARCDLKLSLPVERKSGRVCEILLTGLPGGHSGGEIHKNYANANRLLAQCLLELPDLRLISLQGGNQDNAIPSAAKAVVVLPPEGVDNAVKKADEAFQRAIAACNTPGNADPSCGFSWESPSVIPESLSPEDSRRVLELILAAPNGVQAMSQDIPGLVQTSLNLGILRLKNGDLCLSWSVRSSVASEKEALIGTLKALADRNGASLDRRGDYPAWEFRKDSPLRRMMLQIYKELSGREAQVTATHGGLECGLFSEKLAGLDAVSIGPDLREVHSPRERLSIASTARTWNYLTEVLTRL